MRRARADTGQATGAEGHADGCMGVGEGDEKAEMGESGCRGELKRQGPCRTWPHKLQAKALFGSVRRGVSGVWSVCVLSAGARVLYFS